MATDTDPGRRCKTCGKFLFMQINDTGIMTDICTCQKGGYTDNFFCLYCTPNTGGQHEKTCKRHAQKEEKEKDELIDRFGKILDDIGEITGQKKDIGVDELIEELKKRK